MKRLAFVLVLALCQQARTDDSEPGELIANVPDELRRFDPAVAAARRAVVARALGKTTDPLARAVLVLELADSYHAEAIATFGQFVDRSTYRAAVRARSHAADLYAALFCDPAGTDREPATCAPDPALARWRRLDGLLHRYAFLLGTIPNQRAVLAVDQRLVDVAPTSPYAAEARIALGDDAYRNHRDDVAAAHYENVIASEAPVLMRAYASYRAGWVYLRRRQARDAFASFALARSLDPETTLGKAALHQLVRAYAELGEPAGAYDAFHGIAPGREIDLLDKLAQMWAPAESEPKANAVLAELVRRAPADSRRCRWQAHLVHNQVDRNELAAMLPEAEHLVEVFERVRVFERDEVVMACADATRELTFGVARRLERAPRKSRDVVILITRLDALFARAFPRSDK